jgi:hypothetical protein
MDSIRRTMLKTGAAATAFAAAPGMLAHSKPGRLPRPSTKTTLSAFILRRRALAFRCCSSLAGIELGDLLFHTHCAL